jgi:hypothetical protein
MSNSNILVWCRLVILFMLLNCCSANKDLLLVNNLPDDEVIILGTFEYDYSQLTSKNIRGLDLYLNSEEKVEDFNIPRKYLPKGSYKYYRFLSKVGKKGNFDLYYKPRDVYSETNNLLNLMELERNNLPTPRKNILHSYSLNECKIVNIGKVVVYYSGGYTMDGKISYSYTFSTFYGDTTALHAFRESYPEIYQKYTNEICNSRSELEGCINYVLNNISEEKALMIKKFIEEDPDRARRTFYKLTPKNQKAVAEEIEKFSLKELDDFLNENK